VYVNGTQDRVGDAGEVVVQERSEWVEDWHTFLFFLLEAGFSRCVGWQDREL
jgi:hypothetical protein